MRGIKILQQDFVLKMQGGLMREGGVFAGHYGNIQGANVSSRLWTYTQSRAPSLIGSQVTCLLLSPSPPMSTSCHLNVNDEMLIYNTNIILSCNVT